MPQTQALARFAVMPSTQFRLSKMHENVSYQSIIYQDLLSVCVIRKHIQFGFRGVATQVAVLVIFIMCKNQQIDSL